MSYLRFKRTDGERITRDVPLDLSRADLLHPLGVATNSGEVLVPVLGDHHDVFDTNATNALVALEHLLVNMLRVPYGCKKVRREVDARLNSLHRRISTNIYGQPHQRALTTTMPSSSGSRSLR